MLDKKYAKQFAEKVFVGPTHKQAYKKAMKWLAQNVIGNDELKDTEIHFKKGQQKGGSQLPTITITLSVGISEDEIRERHCKCCSEFRSLFYVGSRVNCEWCTVKAYQSRTDDMIRTKREWYKEKLKKSEEKHNGQ